MPRANCPVEVDAVRNGVPPLVSGCRGLAVVLASCTVFFAVVTLSAHRLRRAINR